MTVYIYLSIANTYFQEPQEIFLGDPYFPTRFTGENRD